MTATGYRFISLDTAQAAQRHASLDAAGFYAWLSPIIILAAVALASNVQKLDLERILQPGVQRSSAPPIRETSKQRPSRIENAIRKISWWLDEPVVREFGSRKTLLLGASYAAWLLVLTFGGTGNDYVHLTRRFGHIAVSQLPLHYLLAVKTAKSPIQAITGLSHESLNSYHRLFGRIIHLFFILHVVLYLNFFIQERILGQVIQTQTVRTGIAAIVMFQIIAVTTIPPIRNKSYHAKFYVPHIALSLLVLPVLFLHVPHTRKYIYQAAFLYVFNAATRGASSSALTTANVTKIPGTNLVRITVPGPAWGVPPLMGGKAGWIPGQHVYLKRSKNPYIARSPFTIVGLPPKFDQDTKTLSRGMELVVRDLGGPTTGWLAQSATTGKASHNLEVFLEGPYGQARTFVTAMLEAEKDNMSTINDNYLLVAGGVGATFILPIYLSLMDRCAKNVRLVMLTRSAKEVDWVIDYLSKAKLPANASIDIEVHITKRAVKTELLDVNAESQKTGLAGLSILSNGSRPQMSSMVKGSFVSGTGKVTVLCCGPQGLSKELRAEIGKYVIGEGRDVNWHEETYGLGE